MSDFMSLFFMERSYFHIKYSLKTFHNIVHALMYAQMISSYGPLARIGAQINIQHAPHCVNWAEEV